MFARTTFLLTTVFCAALINTAAAQTLPQSPPSMRPQLRQSTQPQNLDDSLWRQMTNPHELMRIGRDSCLHNDFRAAARIYCRAFTVGSRVEHAVLNHFARYAADADSADKADALSIFRNCVLAYASSDTAIVRDWLANQYGHAGFFDAEIAVLVDLDLADAPTGRRLAEAARGHFSRRRYRHAATAAAAAHGRIEEDDTRNNTAFLAYQSYLQLGIRDSALIWLKTSGSNNRDAQVQAVALRQETGLLAEAAALIDSLPVSLSKDTLRVRQYIFSGETAKALNEVLTSRSASWSMNPRDRALWRGRAMIFGGGQVYEAAAVLDSIRFQANWHGAAEMLRYRYWIQKLDDDINALSLWGKLEHFIYIGDLTAAAVMLGGENISGVAGEMMAVRLAREFAKAGRHAEGLDVLGTVRANPGRIGEDGRISAAGMGGRIGADIMDSMDGRSSEYLYFMAETLTEAGRSDDARTVIKKILNEFPNDIFAQKARVLLMKINS